ncbi:MAG: NAD(P)H-binding protein [Polyangiales bacterium]
MGDAAKDSKERPLLLTGATGFVGRHLLPALKASGIPFVCATRDVERARAKQPQYTWRYLDMTEPASLAEAMKGCSTLVNLVHQMGGGRGYPEREAQAARDVAAAAESAGVERIVFLGGPDPGPNGSTHLQSRLRAGSLLRSGSVPAVELRAAMIVGHGSTGWQMIRSLAKRLPAMVLPRWAQNHSWPVDIEDAVTAIMSAITMPLETGCSFDVPGPQRLTHQEVLTLVGRALGKERPMVNVPVLTPKLSSYWITLITGIDLHLTQQLVAGVVVDLDPTVPVIWDHVERQAGDLALSAEHALADERTGAMSPERRARLERIGKLFARE